MPLTPEEIEQYRRMWPMLPLEEGDLARPGVAMAPNVPPTVAVGQAPDPVVGSSTPGELERLRQTSLAREQALSQPQGTSWKDAAAFGLAATADAATRLAAIRRGGGPGGTNQLGALVEAKQQREAQREQMLMKERQFQVDILNHIGTANKEDMEAHQKALGLVTDVLKNPLHKPEDRERVITTAVGLLAQRGIDGRKVGDLFRSMSTAIPETFAVLGEYANAFDMSKDSDRDQFRVLESTVIAAGFKGPEAWANLPEYARSVVARKVGPEVLKEAVETSRRLGALPEFQVDGRPQIPMAILYDKFESQYGQRGAQAHRDYVMGLLGTKEANDRLQAGLADLGYRDISVAGKAQEAGARTKATRLAETSPEVTASAIRAENEREAGTRGEKLTTKKAQDRIEEQKQANLKDMENRFRSGQPPTPDDFRRDYEQRSSTFLEVKHAYGRALAAAEVHTPMADVSIVFAYMKLLDPTTGVREGERADVGKAASIPDRISNLYNMALEGKSLNPTQRADLLDQIRRLWKSHRESQVELESEFQRIGKRYGVDPEGLPDLIGRFRHDMDFSRKGPAPESAGPRPTHRWNPRTGKLEPVK